MPQLSKQQLLDNLSTLDRVRLEKLWSYADLLLIPESDLLVNVTMRQMLDKVFSLADTYFPDWTDRSHSDFGRFLAELLCLFSEKDYWYINAFANEAFLHKTRVYGNAYYKALELGYQPQLYASSKCQVSLTFSAGTNLNVKPGDIMISIAGYTLSNTQYFTVTNAGTQVVVTEFAVGTYTTKTTEFNGRSVVLPEANIDLSSVNVSVSSVAWSRVFSFSQSSPTDKVYFALPDELASAVLYFGDGVFGSSPAVGETIQVLYRIGGGSMPDVPASAVSVVQYPTGRTIDVATQTTTLSGGADQEPISSIKANAPVIFRTSGRITNPSDAIAILNLQPEIKRSQAILFATTLTFYVIPNDGDPASPTLLSDLTDRLVDKVLMGFLWQGAATTYVDLSPLEVTMYVTPGYVLEDVCSQAAALISSYTDPLEEAEYGRYFRFGLLAGHVVSNVLGVTNLLVNTVNGLPASGYANSEVVVPPPQITRKVDIGSSFSTSLIPNGIQYVANELTINAVYNT